nr:uncharacterized protein LOC118680210 [Bactrocera oleae]
MKYWSDDRSLIAIVIAAILVISTGMQPVSGANILGVLLSPSPSHLIVHMSIMKTLAERGHNITVVSSLKPKVNHPKIHNIIIEPTEARQKEVNDELYDLGMKKQNPIVMMMKLLRADSIMVTLQLDVVKNKKFQSI